MRFFVETVLIKWKYICYVMNFYHSTFTLSVGNVTKTLQKHYKNQLNHSKNLKKNHKILYIIFFHDVRLHSLYSTNLKLIL